VGSRPAERGGEHGVRGRAGEPGNPPGSTRPPEATRYLETRQGLLSYRELAPWLAQRVGDLEARIVAGAFDHRPLDGALVQTFHHALCSDLVPEWAGHWRDRDVIVGNHQPPPSHEIALHMRNYAEDLAARWSDSSTREDERLLEMLAFAEGRLLWIHPFRDFNGRVTRLFLRELLRRLDITGVSLAPLAPVQRAAYLAALAEADHGRYQALMAVWAGRFENTPLE
jgi:fido (protein-threonine AMPylation protein)